MNYWIDIQHVLVSFHIRYFLLYYSIQINSSADDDDDEDYYTLEMAWVDGPWQGIIPLSPSLSLSVSG